MIVQAWPHYFIITAKKFGKLQIRGLTLNQNINTMRDSPYYNAGYAFNGHNFYDLNS